MKIVGVLFLWSKRGNSLLGPTVDILSMFGPYFFWDNIDIGINGKYINMCFFVYSSKKCIIWSG